MLLLDRTDVQALLSLGDCTRALEAALQAHVGGRTLGPASLSVPARGGGFHVKAAGLDQGGRALFAAKVNGNFPGNPAHGRPTIQGLIVLCDAGQGTPLAVMDSTEITALRTAAATALAARHLAPAQADTATVIGCGVQGRVQAQAIAAERPLRRLFLVDIVPAQAQRLARELQPALSPSLEPAADVREAVRRSQVVVTCTTAHAPLFDAADVPPGAFVAAVGADNPAKQELDPRLLGQGAVVVDSLEQCAAYGELRHALAAGALSRDAVRAELAEVVAGTRPGRLSAEEIVVFDSTGTALQDVAAAAWVYEAALKAGKGASANLSGDSGVTSRHT